MTADVSEPVATLVYNAIRDVRLVPRACSKRFTHPDGSPEIVDDSVLTIRRRVSPATMPDGSVAVRLVPFTELSDRPMNTGEGTSMRDHHPYISRNGREALAYIVVG